MFDKARRRGGIMKAENLLKKSSFQNWGTPRWLFRELDREFSFKLDAAASKDNALCKNFFTKEDNALERDWFSFGSVFCNPPYNNMMAWVKKAYLESLRGSLVVMVVPGNTSTRWFHEWVLGKAEIRFVKGKVKFVGPCKGGAIWPTLILIYRGKNA